jgi:hypothetical protein
MNMARYWTTARRQQVFAALDAANIPFDEDDGIMFHHTGAKANTVTIRRGFFYRNGFDDHQFAALITAAGFAVDDHLENWQAWPKDSYWWVRFHLVETPTVETPAAPDEMPALVMPPMDDSAVMPMTYTDWLILSAMARAEGTERDSYYRNTFTATLEIGAMKLSWVSDNEWFAAEYLAIESTLLASGSIRIDKRDTVRTLAAWVNQPAPVEPTPEPAVELPKVGDTISYNRKGLRMRPVGEVIVVEPAAPAYVVIKSFTGMESRVMATDIVTIIPADEPPAVAADAPFAVGDEVLVVPPDDSGDHYRRGACVITDIANDKMIRVEWADGKYFWVRDVLWLRRPMVDVTPEPPPAPVSFESLAVGDAAEIPAIGDLVEVDEPGFVDEYVVIGYELPGADTPGYVLIAVPGIQEGTFGTIRVHLRNVRIVHRA